MRTYHLPVTHRPHRDGSAVATDHVTFYLANEVVSEAWGRFLEEETGGLVTNTDVAIVRVEFDYLLEQFVSPSVRIDVALLSVGRASVRLGLRMYRGQDVAAEGVVVLAQVGNGRTTPDPFDDRQRAALEALLETEPWQSTRERART